METHLKANEGNESKLKYSIEGQRLTSFLSTL